MACLILKNVEYPQSKNQLLDYMVYWATDHKKRQSTNQLSKKSINQLINQSINQRILLMDICQIPSIHQSSQYLHLQINCGQIWKCFDNGNFSNFTSNFKNVASKFAIFSFFQNLHKIVFGLIFLLFSKIKFDHLRAEESEIMCHNATASNDRLLD